MSQDKSTFLSDQTPENPDNGNTDNGNTDNGNTDNTLDAAAASDQAVLVHLSLLFGLLIPIPFIGIIAPLIIWQTTKANNSLMDKHGRNAMNWAICSTVYSVLLPLTVVGLILVPVVAGMGLVCPIIAAVKAAKGEVWKYPLTFNVLGDRPEKSLRRAALALLSLCIFPLAAFVGSGIWGNRHNQWLSSLSKGSGTVTEIVEEPNAEGNTLFKPIVSFNDQTGETYRVSPFFPSETPNHREGEAVEVLYSPTNPSRALLNTWVDKWLVVAMAVGFSALWLVFSVIPSLVCLVMSWFIKA